MDLSVSFPAIAELSSDAARWKVKHLIKGAVVEACCATCRPVRDNVASWEEEKKNSATT